MKSPTKQSICMTCGAEVDWRYSESARTWQAFNHADGKLHRCAEESA